jgi:hypothetical protein
MKYSFDTEKWIAWLLPAVVRRAKMLAWLKALLKPVKTLHSRFYMFTSSTEEILSSSPQVVVLRGILNHKFDVTEKRIDVLDAQNSGQTWVYLEGENQPLYMPLFLSSGERFDFVVRVPTGLSSVQRQIEAVLNRFKMPSKKYKIELY